MKIEQIEWQCIRRRHYKKKSKLFIEVYKIHICPNLWDLFVSINWIYKKRDGIFVNEFVIAKITPYLGANHKYLEEFMRGQSIV